MRLHFKDRTAAITFLPFEGMYLSLILPPLLYFLMKSRRHSAGGLRVRPLRKRNQTPVLQRPRLSSSLRRLAATPRLLDRRTPLLIMEAPDKMLRKSLLPRDQKKSRPHRRRTLSHEPRGR